jgi:hypothetical protein
MISLIFLLSLFEKSSFLGKILLIFSFSPRVRKLPAILLPSTILFYTVATASIFLSWATAEKANIGSMVSYLAAPALILYALNNEPSNEFSNFRRRNIVTLATLIAGIATNYLMQSDAGGLQNANILAFIWTSLSYCMLDPSRTCARTSFSHGQTYMLLAGLIIFKSRIILLVIIIKTIFILLTKLSKRTQACLKSAGLLAFVIFYLTVGGSLAGFTTLARSYKLENYDGSDTYADSFRLIAAPQYVMDSISKTEYTFYLGHGFASIPTFDEESYTMDTGTVKEGNSKVDRLHNAMLTALYQTGVVGLAAFSFFLISVIYFASLRLNSTIAEYLFVSFGSLLFLPAIMFGCQQVTVITVFILSSKNHATLHRGIPGERGLDYT